jgi:hypothetical protein
MLHASRIRRRILLAMGLLTAACEEDAGPPASVADSAVQADTAGTDAVSDAVAGTDAQAATDAALAETGGGTDADSLTDIGVAGTDAVAATDIVAGTDTLASTDIAAATDVSSGSDVVPGPTCPSGTAEVQCLTSEQLLAIINNPPMGGKAIPYSGPLPPNGCPGKELVLDGCCMPAVAEGVLDGDRCCYYWCPGACCGRPLYVDGAVRTAALQQDRVWGPAGSAAQSALSGPAAAACAAAWQADALDEHASIASFARFSLDLLAFGAPAELLRDAAGAMQDEVRHVGLCLGVAGTLGAAAAGPGPLPLAGLAVTESLAQAAVAALLEGGVGETVAAAVLSEAAAHALPELREPLLLMAADEARHAGLSWRFVAWALREDAAALGQLGVHQAIARALAEVVRQPVQSDPRELLLAGLRDDERLLGGRLAAGRQRSLTREILCDVVVPCAEAILQATQVPQA